MSSFKDRISAFQNSGNQAPANNNTPKPAQPASSNFMKDRLAAFQNKGNAAPPAPKPAAAPAEPQHSSGNMKDRLAAFQNKDNAPAPSPVQSKPAPPPAQHSSGNMKDRLAAFQNKQDAPAPAPHSSEPQHSSGNMKDRLAAFQNKGNVPPPEPKAEPQHSSGNVKDRLSAFQNKPAEEEPAPAPPAPRPRQRVPIPTNEGGGGGAPPLAPRGGGLKDRLAMFKNTPMGGPMVGAPMDGSGFVRARPKSMAIQQPVVVSPVTEEKKDNAGESQHDDAPLLPVRRRSSVIRPRVRPPSFLSRDSVLSGEFAQ
ncbi:uncharacterized protein GO595_000128 [Histomonas meleagridis]|uniref:uncharacterized protein n=1 Tax=Histomonas meleagridis TaxID=135588 RepID=UPI003559B990|nr:hypothetical protein GO595_000128 [Histomonas meleagridis]